MPRAKAPVYWTGTKTSEYREHVMLVSPGSTLSRLIAAQGSGECVEVGACTLDSPSENGYFLVFVAKVTNLADGKTEVRGYINTNGWERRLAVLRFTQMYGGVGYITVYYLD
jgi:hypothetical protein